MPSTRVWNSGGAPKMSWLAMVGPLAALLGAGAADEDAAGTDAAADDGAGAADDAAAVVAGGAELLGVPAVFLELLQPASPRASVMPVAPMSRTLRFMRNLLWRAETVKSSFATCSLDCRDLRLDDVGRGWSARRHGFLREAA